MNSQFAVIHNLSLMDTEDVQAWLKALLLGLDYEPGQQGEDRSEVILSVTLDDGYRYVLTRIPHCPFSLSAREWEIVKQIAEGKPNKVIAQTLDISPFTVATHLRRIFVKLGVNSRAEMMARAMELDLLNPAAVG